MKKVIIGIFIVILIILSFVIFYALKRTGIKNQSIPQLTLLGDQTIYIERNSIYREPGYVGYDKIDKDITNKVIVTNNIDISREGAYQIIYKLTNSSGKSVTAKRNIVVIEKEEYTYKDEYDDIDNTILNWGLSSKKDGSRPTLNTPSDVLKQYNAYAIGKEERVLYLTFDEGALESYLDEIVKVLDENEVKATFFLCKNYMKNNPDLIRSMVSNGHSIGNHTASHPSMPTLANRANFLEFVSEITDVEDAFYEITGVNMEKIYREPKGEYSYRSLAIMQDFGYKTYFWSAAYQDWLDNLSHQEALDSMYERVHDGAVYLLHPSSKGNYLALDTFIKTMKDEGYTFDLVKNIE